jgi:GDPmannose 4,6-dehydratase
MMQQPTPEDFFIATGITTTVRYFIKMSFKKIGVKLIFTGEGKDEQGIVESCQGEFAQTIIPGTCVVKVDKRYFRPTEVDLLIGDATKAKNILGWVPELTLQDIVTDMMQSDINLMKKEKFLKDNGYNIHNYFE